MNARDAEAIRPAVEAIVEKFHPEQVLLFGSRARGDAREDSDFDLMIVGESSEERWRRVIPVYEVIMDHRLNIDVVWWTKEEIEDWKGLRSYYLSHALKDAILIYESDTFGSRENALAEGAG